MTGVSDRCDCCGAKGRPLDAHDQCSDCRVRALETDSYAAKAIADTLGASAKASLDYLTGEDVRRIVSEAVSEAEEARHRQGLTPLRPVAEIDAALHKIMSERIAASDEVSA